MNDRTVGAPEMSYFFPQPPRNVFYQLSPAELIEQAILRKEGWLTETGTFAADAGKGTVPGAGDRFIVEDDKTRNTVFWGKQNQRFAPESFKKLKLKLAAYLAGRDVFVRDVRACANEKYHIDIRVVTETAYQSLFADNLYLGPGTPDASGFPEWTVVAAPGFKAIPVEDGVRGENFTIISFDQKTILIGGTGHCGEIKNGIALMLNFILPVNKGVLPMHCAANAGQKGDTALFFGLSGTGKSTLSADDERMLIGDDAHGWSNYTIFNIEGGCYTASAGLSEENNPLTFHAIRFGTLLENIALQPGTRLVDYADTGDAENARATYPAAHISNAVIPSIGVVPRHIFFLTADVFGVLPPVALLTAEQAAYYFISGYSGKIKRGNKNAAYEAEAIFTPCFGENLMPLHPMDYAALFSKKINECNANVWLINTGWLGGPCGTGKRIKLRYTRAIIAAILNDELHGVHFAPDPVFNINVPSACPGIPDKVLDPVFSWNSPDAYETAATRLAALFHSNFEYYAGSCAQEIEEAGPAFDNTGMVTQILSTYA